MGAQEGRPTKRAFGLRTMCGGEGRTSLAPAPGANPGLSPAHEARLGVTLGKRVSTSEALGTRASAAHHIVAAGANPAWGTRNARLAAWTLDTITNGRMSEDTL